MGGTVGSPHTHLKDYHILYYILSVDQIMAHILITGGGGFLGTNLVKTLLKTDVTVIIVVDNFITGSQVAFQTVLDQLDQTSCCSLDGRGYL